MVFVACSSVGAGQNELEAHVCIEPGLHPLMTTFTTLEEACVLYVDDNQLYVRLQSSKSTIWIISVKCWTSKNVLKSDDVISEITANKLHEPGSQQVQLLHSNNTLPLEIRQVTSVVPCLFPLESLIKHVFIDN